MSKIMRNLIVFLLFLGSPIPGQRMNKKYSNRLKVVSITRLSQEKVVLIGII